MKVLQDRTALFESSKYPGQHATFDPSGKAADTRGQPNIPGRLFTAYVKVVVISLTTRVSAVLILYFLLL